MIISSKSFQKAAALFIALSFQIGCGPDPGPGQPAVRIATIQLDSADVGNFAKMTSLAIDAKEQGAQLVVFPEESAFGWLNPAVFTDAKPIPGEISAMFVTMAQEAQVWVAAGLGEQAPGTGIPPGVHEAHDSGILVDPDGTIVLHHRQYSVVQNAFDEAVCMQYFGMPGCSYTPGPLSDILVVDTPFGRTAILVCADAYTSDTTVLDTLKPLNPELVIVNWGVTAATQAECGTSGFNATEFAAQAAQVLETAYVVGANGVGDRLYGRFLPSVYCGTSGFATPSGEIGGVADTTQPMALFDVPLGQP